MKTSNSYLILLYWVYTDIVKCELTQFNMCFELIENTISYIAAVNKEFIT